MPRRATSLIIRCEEIASALIRAETSLGRLRTEFSNLQTLLARLQADDEVAPIVTHNGQHGDVLRTILSTLRLSNGPMELRDITLRMMNTLGMDAENARLVRVMLERTRVALLRQEKAGVVRAERSGNRAALWGLTVVTR